MMNDTDLEEYHSIGKPIRWSNKYSYVTGTRHEEHGTRTYDVNGSRLPSVTTILGRTKNQQFIKVKSNNESKEYYLTDVIELINNSGTVKTKKIDNPKEIMGINTIKQLELLQK